MPSKLPSENIGSIGESQFTLWCHQASLVCNKSQQDVTGWDFAVEFPFPNANVPMDRRQPSACVVQVKTTTSQSLGRVALKLSAAERLAKDARPAVVVVIRMLGNGQAVSGYVIHLLDHNLATILRRLRLAEQRGTNDINRENVSFNYTKHGQRFDPTPEGLLSALSAVCGADPAAYYAKKQSQLEELGYEDGGLVGEAVFRVNSKEHFNDVMLGLAPLQPIKLSLFDKRFGIAIPYKGTLGDDLAELSLTPTYVGDCEIAIRGSGLSRAAMFSAKIHGGFVGPESLLLLIKNDDFIIKFDNLELKFETVQVTGETGRPLKRWVELLRALSHLATDSATITVTFLSDERIPLVIPSTEPIAGPYHNQLPALAQFVERWQALLEFAGVASTEDILFDEIWEARSAHLAVDIMINPNPTGYIEWKEMNADSEALKSGVMYFNKACLGKTEISYSALMEVRTSDGEEWKFRTGKVAPFHAGPAVTDLYEYGEEQAERAGVRVLVDWGKIIPEDPDRRLSDHTTE